MDTHYLTEADTKQHKRKTGTHDTGDINIARGELYMDTHYLAEADTKQHKRKTGTHDTGDIRACSFAKR
jgi:hypothetical protein